MNEDLFNILNLLNISYKTHVHPAFFTVKEAEQFDKSFTFLRTKSLFLKDENNQFYLITLEAHKRLNMSKLKKHLGLKKIEFANEDELLAHMKVTPGSVSLFCIIYDSKTNLILDKKVWESEKSGFHPNINTSSLEISKEGLHKFYNYIPNNKEVFDLD